MRIAPDAEHGGTGAAAEETAASDRGAAEGRQERGILAHRVDGGGIGVGGEAPPTHEPIHARNDRGEQPRHLVVGGGRCGDETEPAVRVRDEDTVEHERVEVDVEIHGAPEALDSRNLS